MTQQSSRVGSQFGPYRLDALLGRGGMGEVYRAYDTIRDREVALKLLHEKFAGDPTYEERFRRECQAVAKLGEPHIIPIHDYGEIDGVLFLDMRMVEGEDLRARLRRTGPLTPADAVALVEQVATALDAAHKAGLVHRDVKPENILVTENDFAYLVDFGIAHADGDTKLTQTGTAIGSLAYMAPEQLDGVPTSAASDVYALAAVLFEMLVGRSPYPGDSVSAVVKATVLGNVPAPSNFNHAVSPQLDAVVTRGLAKDPAARFPAAGEFAKAAAAALEGHWPDAGGTPTGLMGTGGASYNPTMIGQRPSTASYSGPQSFSGPQVHSGPQQFSGPQQMGPQQMGPQGYPNYAGPPMAGPMGTGPQMYYQEPKDSRAMQIVLGAIIGLLILSLIGMAVYWFGFRDNGQSDTAAGSSTTTMTQTVDAPPTTEVASPPPGTVNCNSEVGVWGGVTSCEFAQNVYQAYMAGGAKGDARTVNAHSPVTGNVYTMSCGKETGVVVCRGGNNAVVVIF